MKEYLLKRIVKKTGVLLSKNEICTPTSLPIVKDHEPFLCVRLYKHPHASEELCVYRDCEHT